MRRALEEPMRRIASNSGQEGAVVLNTVRNMAEERGGTNIGFNVMSGEFEDMLS